MIGAIITYVLVGIYLTFILLDMVDDNYPEYIAGEAAHMSTSMFELTVQGFKFLFLILAWPYNIYNFIKEYNPPK